MTQASSRETGYFDLLGRQQGLDEPGYYALAEQLPIEHKIAIIEKYGNGMLGSTADCIGTNDLPCLNDAFVTVCEAMALRGKYPEDLTVEFEPAEQF